VLAIGVAAALCARLEAEVVLAAPGREAAVALQAWTQGEERFDAVVCNVRDHDQSGVPMYRAVARARPDLLDRFVFVVDSDMCARRHFLLGEVPNAVVDVGADARTLHAVVRRR
jgi:hypothetical protein